MRGITVRALKLTTITPDGRLETFLTFQRGLNLLCGSSSSGKSTCLMALFYAFGLEKMFAAEGREALPRTLRKEIIVSTKHLKVLASFVEAEIENRGHEVLTLRRPIVGGEDFNRISLRRGSALTGSGALGPEEYYPVQTSGPEEMAFSDRLNAFFSWDIPLGQARQGEDIPLSHATLFPFFYIDQLRGWGEFPGRFFNRLTAQDALVSAFEFLLCLDMAEMTRKKRQIIRELSELKKKWSDLEAFFQELARELGGGWHCFPAPPVVPSDGGVSPAVLLHRNNGWVSLRKMASALCEEYAVRRTGDDPSQGRDGAPGKKFLAKLEKLEKECSRGQACLTEIRDAYFEHRENLQLLQKRMEFLDVEIKALCDKLEEHLLASSHKMSALGAGATSGGMDCRQAATVSKQRLQFLKEKKAALEEEKKDAYLQYKKAYQDLQGVGKTFEEKKEQVSRLRKRLLDLREKRIETEEDESQRRLGDLTQKQEKIRRFNALIEKIDCKNNEIEELTKRWKELLDERSRLQKGTHTVRDKEKLRRFLHLFLKKARLFGCSELHLKRARLSPETYRPLFRSVENSRDIAASDHIRLTWAFHLALMESAALCGRRHPGFLVIDEPAQQNVGEASLRAFYRAISGDPPDPFQILVATSEPSEKLRDYLEGNPAHMINLGKKGLYPGVGTGGHGEGGLS